ncbi:hypothetical protein PVL30_005174 [Lodderomyces elongisporus]|uniref:uncharacterized protein n=1 Tax=Lodderomyces elongisporus TaxID=36914 RepID=UPI00292657D2|nr:uncharacterized protein PVL30_001472 [Lodderomyces elongisporus]XP_001528814.2 uncharacterized protein PVL30_003140 [Lodderomyces elongisporus]XP_060975649.1 uncharacterized protein PVL30_005174 [Lodderomyces elongisporus]WLF77752.1 hypothetical protein PVL30_001472 [Lodderomyces elongisporus]WLF79388.1 hypothetical protein PVL30_003140 [Lodderomyces elongisporus]WLF81377.1 hypothetical protein PVL30_005174 [Lodderomyces elongisporus]
MPYSDIHHADPNHTAQPNAVLNAPTLDNVNSSATSEISNSSEDDSGIEENHVTSKGGVQKDKPIEEKTDDTISNQNVATTLAKVNSENADLRATVNRLTMLVADLTEKLHDSSNKPRVDDGHIGDQAQSTPSTQKNHLSESFSSAHSFKDKETTNMLFQPSAIYDGVSYAQGGGPVEVMIKGYEATCQKINDYRKRFIDNERIEDIPYIRRPDPNVEKVFIAHYNELSTKLIRTHQDELAIKRYDAQKFPSPTSKDFDGFFFWLRKLIWYKHTYFIPDYLLREEVIAVAQSVKNETLLDIVKAATKRKGNEQHKPIKYHRILEEWGKKASEEHYVDIIGEVNRVIKPNVDPKSVMIIVQTEIDNYLENNEIGDLPALTWIRLFKTLFNKLGGVMDQIITYMSSRIKVQRYDDDAEIKEIWINGEDVRHYLTSIKVNSHDHLIAMEMNLSYVDIWDAINTTYTAKMTLINSRQNESKSQNKQKEPCLVCGRTNHKTEVCFRAQNAAKRGMIKIKDGRIYTVDDNELKVGENEFMVKKYPDLFTQQARHREGGN